MKRIYQFTDTHLQNTANQPFKNSIPDVSLKRLIRHALLKFGQPDHVVVSGDLTHDGEASAYELLADCLSDFKCDVSVLPGNHDDVNLIHQHLVNDNISCLQDSQLDTWDLLFANSQITGRTEGHIETRRIHELNQHLSETSRPALLFTHHPPMDTGSQWMDALGMTNGSTVLENMVSHPNLKALVFGHIHQQWDSNVQHLRLLGTPSSCVQFMPQSEQFALDELAPGYRIIELDEKGQFETRVMRVSQQPARIVSGGQTGVDRAALDTAIRLAIPHGGWCPQGRLAEDGVIDVDYQLTETPTKDYRQRTEWNVRDSDATLILYDGELEGGTRLTAELGTRMQKPCLTVDIHTRADIPAFRQWLEKHQVQTLNIAGPRASRHPLIYDKACNLLDELLGGSA